MAKHKPTGLGLLAVLLLLTAVSCSSQEYGNPNSNAATGSTNSDAIAPGTTTTPPKQMAAFGTSPSGQVVDAGPTPIEPTGTPVTADTVLNTGDKVQVLWKGPLTLPDGKSTNESWWSGEVLECNEDGTVSIHYTGWRSEWDESVSRDRLRIDTE